MHAHTGCIRSYTVRLRTVSPPPSVLQRQGSAASEESPTATSAPPVNANPDATTSPPAGATCTSPVAGATPSGDKNDEDDDHNDSGKEELDAAKKGLSSRSSASARRDGCHHSPIRTQECRRMSPDGIDATCAAIAIPRDRLDLRIVVRASSRQWRSRDSCGRGLEGCAGAGAGHSWIVFRRRWGVPG